MNIVKKINNRVRWEFHKIADKIYRCFVQPPYIMSYEECVDFVIANKASITRIGDGELAVIYGKNLGFQTKNAILEEKIRDVLESTDSNLLVCIPDTFHHLNRYNQVEINFWKAHHYFNRKRWYKSLHKDKKYGNTFLSRFYSMEFNKEISTKRIKLLKQLWDGRDIIFIEGKDTKMGVCNDLFDNSKSIRRILCPAKNAFDKYDFIIEKALSVPYNVNNVYILALGPTATVMASDLHKHGLQALDMGHMDIEYEWYSMGAIAKVPITGKFSNEAAILGLAKEAVTGELRDKEYESQIIFDLSK